MVLSDQEFTKIISDKSKRIMENITWEGDRENSEIVKFRVPITSDNRYPIFINGSYNRYLERLSYKIIHKEINRRIYGLDMGKDHKNPDETLVGKNHIHIWSETYGDKKAVSANERIFSTANEPVEVWQEFCREANIDFLGTMAEVPEIQYKIDFDLGGITR